MTGPDLLARAVTAAVTAVLPGPAPLHEPLFGPEEQQAVTAAVAEGWVSTAGSGIAGFEADLATWMTPPNRSSPEVVATSSGTAALHLALAAVGVDAGDEVLMPAATFVATANAAAYLGASPHFVDVAPGTLGLDPAALAERLAAVAVPGAAGPVNGETGRRLGAVVAVHAFGRPPALAALRAVCDRHGLPLVEDAAAALGSTGAGQPPGTHGHAAILSFNGNKIITTGGGGGVVTHEAALAHTVRHLAGTAKAPHPWRFHHDRVGYNYRLPNLNAALGRAQLARLPDWLAGKQRLVAVYAAALAPVTGAALVPVPAEDAPNHWLPLLRLAASDALAPVIEGLNAAGVGARPLWDPLHTLPMYATAPRGPLPETEALATTLVCLPGGPRCCPGVVVP